MDNYDVSKLGSFVNVGSNRAISIHDLSFMIKEVTGYEGYIKFNPNLPDGMPKKLMDSSIANEYGWNNTTDLLKGIKLTYNWYKNL